MLSETQWIWIVHAVSICLMHSFIHGITRVKKEISWMKNHVHKKFSDIHVTCQNHWQSFDKSVLLSCFCNERVLPVVAIPLWGKSDPLGRCMSRRNATRCLHVSDWRTPEYEKAWKACEELVSNSQDREYLYDKTELSALFLLEESSNVNVLYFRDSWL